MKEIYRQVVLKSFLQLKEKSPKEVENFLKKELECYGIYEVNKNEIVDTVGFGYRFLASILFEVIEKKEF